MKERRMELHLSKAKVRLSKWLLFGGLFIAALSLPYLMWRASRMEGFVTQTELWRIFLPPFFLGGCASVVGGAWIEDLFRCPYCRRRLIIRGSKKLARYCPQCGTEVVVVLNSKNKDRERTSESSQF